jgi:hypothetical protein
LVSPEPELRIPPKPTKPSDKAIQMKDKWAAEAKKHDPKAKLVTNAEEALKLIQNVLKSGPMNVTMLHNELRGVVPAPLLKKTLDLAVEEGLKRQGNDIKSEESRNKA